MQQRSVDAQGLKDHLSECLRDVKAGHSIVITESGQAMGRLMPIAAPLATRLQALAEAGLIAWSGRKLQAVSPAVRAMGPQSVSDLLVEDRQ